MLVEEQFDRLYFRDVVNEIFATDSRDKAEALVEDYSRFWMSITGTRGASVRKKKKRKQLTHKLNLGSCLNE